MSDSLYESREQIVSAVKENTDIVQLIGAHVDLKKSGSRYLGLCPFHGEKTPSFSVNPAMQIFKCFGCGEAGDVFSFMMKYNGMDFPAALKELAARCNIQLPEKRLSRKERQEEERRKLLYEVHDLAARIYSAYLLEDGGARGARDYLKRRGIQGALASRFRLGYSPDVEKEGWNFLGSRLPARLRKAAIEGGLLVKKQQGGSYDRFRDRILFPIFDISGRICGFGGRLVGQGPAKYINSPESPIYSKSRLLLGLYQQKDEIRRKDEAIIVEGNFDLLALVAAGFGNVVAPLGTALTAQQVRLLKRFASRVVLLFDGDQAGVKAAVRAAPIFLKEQVQAKVVILPEGHDPDTYIQQEGAERLASCIEEAESLPEFLYTHYEREYGGGLDGKTRIARELGELVKAAATPLQQSIVISHFAAKLGMEESELKKHLEPEPVPERQVPESHRQRDRRESVRNLQALSMGKRQVLGAMILYPEIFNQLEQAGVREYLAGTIGEVIFLEMQRMLGENPEFEPEDLLSNLEDEEERQLVSELLKNPPEFLVENQSSGETVVRELVLHLEEFLMRKQVEELRRKMADAQAQGDAGELTRLLAENLRLERRLHALREKA